MLVDFEAKLNLTDKSGNSALLLSLLNKHSVIAEYLLENGACPNFVNKLKLSPLTVAVKLGFTTTVQLLVDKGADINVYDSKGNTPLMITRLQRGKQFKKIAEILIEAQPSRRFSKPVIIPPVYERSDKLYIRPEKYNKKPDDSNPDNVV